MQAPVLSVIRLAVCTNNIWWLAFTMGLLSHPYVTHSDVDAGARSKHMWRWLGQRSLLAEIVWAVVHTAHNSFKSNFTQPLPHKLYKSEIVLISDIRFFNNQYFAYSIYSALTTKWLAWYLGALQWAQHQLDHNYQIIDFPSIEYLSGRIDH